MRALILAWSIPLCFYGASCFFFFLSGKGFHSRSWALAFLLLGTGYAITTFQFKEHSIIKALIEDIFFLMGAVAMANAFSRRFAEGRRWKLKALVILVTLIGAWWAVCVKHSVRLETFVIQMGCVFLLCTSLHQVYLKQTLGRGDRVLRFTFTCVIFLLAVQCIGYLIADDTPAIVGAWRRSNWGFVFELTGVAVALGLTIAILLSICLDVIDRLNWIANTDHLTGLLNRRGFEDAYAQLHRNCASAPFFLALMDLDHFKQINDTHGHDVGDLVLVEFARLLRNSITFTGRVGRLGGEEFAVILTGLDRTGATLWCEQLRQSFADVKWSFNKYKTGRTVSIGLIEFCPGQAYMEVLGKADVLLYQAKGAGRNRVTAGGDEKLNCRPCDLSASISSRLLICSRD